MPYLFGGTGHAPGEGSGNSVPASDRTVQKNDNLSKNINELPDENRKGKLGRLVGAVARTPVGALGLGILAVSARSAGKNSDLSPGLHSISPTSLNFSQKTIDMNKVDQLASEMNQKGWKGSPIDVVRMEDGTLTTIDHHRVMAAEKIGINVMANVHSYHEALPTSQSGRFGPNIATWGEAISSRISNQGSIFSNTYPNGSPVIGIK